jgi:radical SAM superfamily enzyme YgiQ (UPF0313 family)
MISSLEVARYAKQNFSGLKTIFGGVYSSILKDKIFEFPEVDFSCVGEGELALAAFLDQFEKKQDNIDVPGIYYRSGDKIIQNGCTEIITNLDELPFNDFDFWNPKSLFKISDHLQMMASRGCQYNCTFCTQSAMHDLYDIPTNNKYHRLRSPTNICDEIEYQLEKYKEIINFRGIIFNDDTFTSNRKWVTEFCNEYTKRGLEKKCHWAINARIDNLDERYLIMLKKAGCYYIYFGLETITPKTQKAYKKVFEFERIKRMTKFMHKVGIRFRVYYIIDGPFESVEDNLECLKTIRKLKPETFQVMPFVPLPNTKAAEIYKKSNPHHYQEKMIMFNIEKSMLSGTGSTQLASPLVSVGIGHMTGSYFNLINHILTGLFSTDKRKRLYTTVLINTILSYIQKCIILGKHRFFIDLLRYFKQLLQNKLGISDLFGLTLKRYILERSFE